MEDIKPKKTNDFRNHKVRQDVWEGPGTQFGSLYVWYCVEIILLNSCLVKKQNIFDSQCVGAAPNIRLKRTLISRNKRIKI